MEVQEPNVSTQALLQAVQAGEDGAFDHLFERVYEELRRLARQVRRGRADATLNTTALVHEAYIKLLPSQTLAWQDRAHFLRVAARAMRQVLVQAARHRMRQKRGGNALTVAFNEQLHAATVQASELLSLDEALNRLEQLDARQARIVECRFFAGLTVEETAAVLDISTPTVKRDWRAARAWLARALNNP